MVEVVMCNNCSYNRVALIRDKLDDVVYIPTLRFVY